MSYFAPSLRNSATLLGALALAAVPLEAHAGGLEYTGQGTQSLARGGAVAARASDPLVLAHNPAGLAELQGSQMLLDLNLAFMSACVDPIGYYGWGTYRGGAPARFTDPDTGETEIVRLGQTSGMTVVEADYYVDPYDTVCLNQNVAPVPQLAFTTRVTDRLGIGFGLVFPAVQPSGAWGGNGTGMIRGDTGELRPAATRYQQLVSNNLGVFPNLGLGYRLADWLRVGVALEYGFVAVDNTTMAGATGGTAPNNDIIVHVEAFDYFVPAFTGSLHLVPTDSLDIVFAFRWQDAINAKGLAEFTSGYFDPTKQVNTSRVDLEGVHQNMPWKLRGGIRYASRRVARRNTSEADLDADGHKIIHDPLQDERWDIELDVEYQLNSRNQEQLVDFVDGSRIEFKPMGNAEVPNEIRIQKRWQDQASVRLGGTVNLVPGVFAVSAGAHYETRGIDPNYMQIDFWPLQRLGLHAGITYRLSRSFDINISYAHIFQETLVVAPPAHRNRREIYTEYDMTGVVNGIDKDVGAPYDIANNGVVRAEEQPVANPDGVAALAQNTNTTATGEPPFITNAGRYRSSFDVLAIGANIHF